MYSINTSLVQNRTSARDTTAACNNKSSFSSFSSLLQIGRYTAEIALPLESRLATLTKFKAGTCTNIYIHFV